MRWVRLEFPVTGTATIDGHDVHGTAISRDPLSGELWLLTDAAGPAVAAAQGQGYAICPDGFTPDTLQRALTLLGEYA